MPTRERRATTKHAELTQTLRQLVSTLQPGDRLPSQAELMRQYRVSDRTVLRSIDELRRAGWIERRHGSGTYVADPRKRDVLPPTGSARESSILAVLALSQPPSPFYQRCLDLLSGFAQEAGLSLVCHHAPRRESYQETFPLELLQPRGFVIFNHALAPVARVLADRGHRVVVLGPPLVDSYPEVPHIYGDHEHGGYLATKHLLQLGHRRLAYVRKENQQSLPRSYRWRGHERAMAEARADGQAVCCQVVPESDFTEWCSDPGAAGAFFRGPKAPTGVLVWNDSEAALLLRILQSAGIRVPDDVSLVGYDALPEGEQTFPPLTTVEQHIETQLRAAVDLLGRPDPPPPSHSVVVVPSLVCRASSAACGSCGGDL